MKKIITKKTECLINERETKLIEICLDYTWHRLTKHKCGIDGMVNIKELNQLREELKELNQLKEELKYE